MCYVFPIIVNINEVILIQLFVVFCMFLLRLCYLSILCEVLSWLRCPRRLDLLRDLSCNSSSLHVRSNPPFFDLILRACCHVTPSCCFWISMLCLVVPSVHLRIPLVNTDWQMTMKMVLLTRKVCLAALTVKMDCMPLAQRLFQWSIPWTSSMRRYNCDTSCSFAVCTLSLSLWRILLQHHVSPTALSHSECCVWRNTCSCTQSPQHE